MKNETSNIPVSQPKIIELGKKTLRVAKDFVELAAYGIGAKFIAEFESEMATAVTFKTDEQIVQEGAALTEKKNIKLSECYKWMKQVKTFFVKIVKPNSAEAKLFPQNMQAAKNSEAIMIDIMPDVFELIENNKAALLEKDMPEDLKTKGEALLKELDDLNSAQENMKDDNKKYTTQRHIALSKIYNRINEVNNAGRQKFADDPEKLPYFDSPWPSTPAPKTSAEQNTAPEPAK